jgi:hypothetical protein
MHRSETEELIQCLACGAEISIDRDRSFAITQDDGLCFACALKRGGVYDELHDTWTRAPDVTDYASVEQPA